MNETASTSNVATDSPTVLIAEDERDLADLYTTWLADSYVVKTAYDGNEALDELDASVDVVLLDRRMPGLSGDDVLDHIRREGLDVRVVIVSAVTPDFDVIDMGFDKYLTKPVDADELHDTVEQMLRRTEYDETLREYQQLVATRAALQAEKSSAELRGNEEFATLQERIAKVQTEVDAVADDFTDEDFEAAFRDLGSNPPDRSSGDEESEDEPSNERRY